MLESGLQLNQFTYKALIHGFCKAKELDKAKEALFEMVDAGTHMTSNVSYLIYSCHLLPSTDYKTASDEQKN